MSEKHTPKKQPLEDWHPADIVATLRKAGWSLSRLSIHHGYKDRGTLKCALSPGWPKGERIIAETLGLHPSDIWPSRYGDKSTRARKSINVKDKQVA